jgi:hypothetical protein
MRNGVINTEKYIKLKVDGLADGPRWIHKPDTQNGTLIHDSKMATVFNEEDAWTMRKNVGAQLPGTVTITFDLEK